MATLILTDMHRQATRHLLLEAAIQVFSEKGFLGCTMGDIVTVAGISEMTAYRYFSSKRKLFEACVEFEMERSLPPLHLKGKDRVEDLEDLLVYLKVLMGEGEFKWRLLYFVALEDEKMMKKLCTKVIVPFFTNIIDSFVKTGMKRDTANSFVITAVGSVVYASIVQDLFLCRDLKPFPLKNHIQKVQELLTSGMSSKGM